MSPTVLELRIHGVNNTPPHRMLCLPENEIRKQQSTGMPGGNTPSSFWEPVNQSEDRALEAYSWGGMARSSPDLSRLPGFLKRFNKPIEFLSVLLRIAWALLLPFGLANVGYWSRNLRPRGERPPWNSGSGAATIRWFGLGLTMLLTLTLCEVALNQYAIQCAPADACAKLPDWLDWFRGQAVATRVALCSVVPIAFLGVLWALTDFTRFRYESVPNDKAREGNGELLADRELWSGDSMLRELTWIHLAAGLSVVTLVSSVGAWGTSFWFQVTTVLAGAALLAAGGLAARRASDAPDVRSDTATKKAPPTRWLFIATGAVLAGHLAALLVLRPELTAPLWVSSEAPAFLLAFLIGVMLSAMAWRSTPKGQPRWWGGFAAAGLLLMIAFWHGVVATLLGAAALLVLSTRDKDRRWQAWSGRAPAMFLSLSLTASMALSTIVVVGVGRWLGADIPRVYELFSGAFTGALLLLGGFVVLLALLTLVRLRRRADDTPLRVRFWRGVAALAHRAEVAVGLLATFGALALVVTVGETLSERDDVPHELVDAGLKVTFWAAVAVVGAFAGIASARPLGLLWDLMCFLPRAAHPFAPPCYAERAVPELIEHTENWLSKSDDRRVILSAHSLGAVLAMATVFGLSDEHRKRVTLITYGTQLRPYFGRIFPELLGPAVLGTPRCRGGRPWRTDPWHESDDDCSPSIVVQRWTNLWRKTDFLGFPAYSYTGDNGCDRQASEEYDGKVHRHSNYQSSPEYKGLF